jgi:hypothetical protein
MARANDPASCSISMNGLLHRFEGLETDKPVMLAYIDSVDPGS